ncbi:hypothetical protein MNBD_NITROSPINAE03-363, partial [hydrothermal vent metagenome]
MYFPIRRFFLQSLGLHTIFFLFTGFIVVIPDGSVAPIKVVLIEAGPNPDNDLLAGVILETPKPLKEKKPDSAKVLSHYDSKAGSPEKGGEYKADKTAIPRKSIDPPAPSKEKAKEDINAAKLDKPIIKIASLTSVEKSKSEETVSKDMNIFSEEALEKTEETEKAKIFEKSFDEREEKHRKLSSLMTDRPDPESEEVTQVIGMPGVEGAEIESMATSDTDDVVDMGDEAIVSLNTKSFKYMDYFVSIKQAMETVWAYPEEAILQGLSGRTMLQFTVGADGSLEDVQVVKSSGHK